MGGDKLWGKYNSTQNISGHNIKGNGKNLQGNIEIFEVFKS